MISQLILASSLISLAHTACLLDSDRQFGNSCYIFVNQRMDFDSAENSCRRQPQIWANLAKIDNVIESNYLARTAATIFGMEHGSFWIGVYRPTVYDPFKTMDGRYCQYTHFKNANPSMDYAAESVTDGYWSTFSKETRMPFVCYYPASEAYASTMSSDWLENLRKTKEEK